MPDVSHIDEELIKDLGFDLRQFLSEDLEALEDVDLKVMIATASAELFRRRGRELPPLLDELAEIFARLAKRGAN